MTQQVSEIFPRYIQKETVGSIVLLIKCFLLGAGFGQGSFGYGAHYNKYVADAMSKFQQKHGIETDGNCGPQTRDIMFEKYGFDLVVAYSEIRDPNNPTCFVQPEGDPIYF